MTVIILFFSLPLQEFERKGLPVPKALIDNKPEATFTIASLSYKAARLYHRYGETKKMLAAIAHLPDKEDQIKFLQKHGYLEDAAQLMCSDGELFSFKGSTSKDAVLLALFVASMAFCRLCLLYLWLLFIFCFVLYFVSNIYKNRAAHSYQCV